MKTAPTIMARIRSRILERGKAVILFLVLPFFPAALQNVDILELDLVPQAFRDSVAGVARLAAAIDDDLALRRPGRQHRRQERVPFVLVQTQRARDMRFGKRFFGPGIDPEHGPTPVLCLFYADGRGINRPLLPRNRAPIVKRLPDRGQKRKSEQKEDLPNEHAAHGYFLAAAL